MNLNILSPCDLKIPLLGLYQRELKACVHTETGTQIMVAVLTIKVPNWKQSKSTSTEQWVKKKCGMVHKRNHR